MSHTLLLILIILPIVISVGILFMFRGRGPSVLEQKVLSDKKSDKH